MRLLKTLQLAGGQTVESISTSTELQSCRCASVVASVVKSPRVVPMNYHGRQGSANMFYLTAVGVKNGVAVVSRLQAQLLKMPPNCLSHNEMRILAAQRLKRPHELSKQLL